MTSHRFATVFASTAVVAALIGGVGGLALGQSHHAAPTAPVSQVGAVQTEPAVSTPAVPLGNPSVEVSTPAARSATVTVVKAAKPAAPSKPKAPKVTDPEHTTPQSDQVQAVEVDPTPASTTDPTDVPWTTDGAPKSMNGTPDPTVGAVPAPESTPTPLGR